MRVADEYRCPSCGLVFRAGANDAFRHGDVRVCPGCRKQITIDLPPPPLDPTPYGHALAERVASFLQAGGEIPSRHPYFSGVCLAQTNGAFLYGHASVGGAPAFYDTSPVIRRFEDRAAFVDWLATQSDATLNQGRDEGPSLSREIGITRRLLEAAVGPDPM